MDRALNPYAPGSGLRPPTLVGRDREIETLDTMVVRSKNRLHNRGMILSGLRGVGKTVLLNRLREHADHMGWFTVQFEAKGTVTGKEAVRARLARELMQEARRRNRRSAGDRLKEALKSVSSFSGTIGLSGASLGIDLNPGRADSGQLEIDLEEMVEDLTAALRAERSAFAIFIDEMQDLDTELLSALIAAQHRAGQQDWPFYVIGAGLPNLPAALSEARSYAERLFDYRTIGPLDPETARDALSEPAIKTGGRYSEDALDILVAASNGYPYFLQEFGKAIWDLAPSVPFTADDAQIALDHGRAQLDMGFFPARWDRATPSERRYLRAMAQDGETGSNTGVVAERLGLKQTSLGPARAQLIAKGLIYAPEHGRVSFTVPGMAAFIHRQHHDD